MSRRADLAIGGLILAAGLTLDLRLFGAADVSGWLPDVAVGATLVGCAVAIRSRGERGTGLLLGVASAAWFAGGILPALAMPERPVPNGSRAG